MLSSGPQTSRKILLSRFIRCHLRYACDVLQSAIPRSLFSPRRTKYPIIYYYPCQFSTLEAHVVTYLFQSAPPVTLCCNLSYNRHFYPYTYSSSYRGRHGISSLANYGTWNTIKVR